jgi:hypothetical protein
MPLKMPRIAGFAVVLTVFAVSPALSQVTVESLLGRIISADNRDQYELTAEFQADLVLVASGRRTRGHAAGTLRESRRAGEPRRWKITVQRLDLPLLLRPFASTLRSLIEDRAESQSQSLETFNSHDFFMDEASSGRYVLIGLRRDIVNEAIDKYGKPADRQDPETRRRIARWLFTSSSMRDLVVRSGPPYALRLVVDEQGLVYENVLFYKWGQAVTKITYTNVGGRPAWHDVESTISSDISGLGHVDGLLLLQIRNYTLTLQ